MQPISMMRIPAGVLLIAVALLAGCETTPGDTLFDPDREALDAPTIESVDPEEYWLGGVGEITITGSGFDPDPDANLVYFDAQRATVVSASETQLVVRTPNYVTESAVLRATLIGAREYSNSLTYRLDPAVAQQAGLAVSDQAVAMAYGDGRIYASTTTSGLPSGIQFVDVEQQSAQQYAAAQSWRYTDLTYDDHTGNVYLARGTTPIIYHVPPGGGTSDVWLLRGGLGGVATVTTDDVGNIWAAGNNAEIYRVNPAQEVTPFPFNANVRSIAYANDALYLAATSDGVNGAWRIPLDANRNAGTPELLLNVTEALASAGQTGVASALSIEAAADGTAFVGVSTSEGIIEIDPDGSWRVFHPGLISGAIVALSYGEPSERYDGSILYALYDPPQDGEANQILRIESLKAAP